MGERSRRRVRDLVAQLAFEGRSQNETERARISMMARSDLLHARAGYRSARPTTVLKIQLATHGRSIQSGHKRTHASQQSERYFDHLVRADQNGFRDRQAQQLCRPGIDDQFMGGGVLDGNVSGLGTL
jgi:hypothetical protein